MGLEIGAIIGIISATAAVGTGVATTVAAGKQRRAQEKQAKLQARLAQAKARRAARIKRAQITAGAGQAGIGGTIIEAPLLAATTTAAAQEELIGRQRDIQIEQFGIQERQTRAAAGAQIAGALGSFTESAAGLFPETTSATDEGEV